MQSEKKETSFDQIYLEIHNGNVAQAFRSVSADATLNLLTDLGVNILQGLFFNGLGKPKEAMESFTSILASDSSAPALVYVGLAESLLLIGVISGMQKSIYAKRFL